MKKRYLIPCLAALLAPASQAQGPIYRCGNEYTNTVSESQKSQCKLLEGGNVTVVQGFKPPAAAPVKVASTAPSAKRVDGAEQKSRDSDARLILESELKKAQARRDELMREYNSGEPEKRGDEARNYQKYLDRVTELKAEIARNSSDLAGIQRELDRVPAAK